MKSHFQSSETTWISSGRVVACERLGRVELVRADPDDAAEEEDDEGRDRPDQDLDPAGIGEVRLVAGLGVGFAEMPGDPDAADEGRDDDGQHDAERVRTGWSARRRRTGPCGSSGPPEQPASARRRPREAQRRAGLTPAPPAPLLARKVTSTFCSSALPSPRRHCPACGGPASMRFEATIRRQPLFPDHARSIGPGGDGATSGPPAARLPALARPEAGWAMTVFFCNACGTGYPDAPGPPAECPICREERQFVPRSGQAWTSQKALCGRASQCVAGA